jgi:regulator of protease activity HflC (stomatin/prohibitin superfamily)
MIKQGLFKKTVLIAEHERALVFKNKQFVDIIGVGKHQYWDVKNELEFVMHNIDSLFFAEQNAERLFRNNKTLSEHIHCWELGSMEVGMLFVDGLLHGVVAPGEHLYLWKDAGELQLEKVSIAEHCEVDKSHLILIERAAANSPSRLIKSKQTKAISPLAEYIVEKDHLGLLYVNGQFVKRITSGKHGFWQFNHEVEVKAFDCKTQLLEISGQEILSKDRVSLRINLSASVKVFDPELAARSISNVDEFVYKSLQLALREAVGTKTLDDILIDKLYVNETVKEIVVQTLSDKGISLESVGVKDIILPGEMKAILNQVVEAQKAAEANVIRRREETSATRSLHNTAKVMENNPTLMRLKELEALEKVAERIDSLTIYDGLDGLMNGVVKIA